MANLYLVATPLGNLGDLSPRAKEILEKVDFVLCEDSRVTQKLLNYFGIRTKTISYHHHTTAKKTREILRLLEEGKNLALVADAGTPGISDPGHKLVREAVKLLRERVRLVPVPGPSALIAAASICGFPMDKFLFLGFPPAKNKRHKFFEQIKNSPYPVILYESPYKIEKTLKELPSEREIVVCRELTKIYETIYRGTPAKVLEEIKKDFAFSKRIKGEFVIVISTSSLKGKEQN